MIDQNILNSLTILYVEDEEQVRELTVNLLSNIVHKVISAKDGVEGLNIFKQHHEDKSLDQIDLIVTDINMPKMNGLEMLKNINNINSLIPSIVTTAHNDAEFLKQAINQRVRGYVSKPLNMSDLVESIMFAAEPKYLRDKLTQLNAKLEQEVSKKTKELEIAIKKLEEKNSTLTYQATHDNLTKLVNRQKLNEDLEQEILRTNRYGHHLTLMMLDIDNFKSINDTFGHDVGDKVLIDIANIIKQSIRSTDIASRWGGEEFMVLLPETSLDDGLNVAQNIRKNIEDYKNDIVKHPITVSIGISLYDKDDDIDSLIKKVDIALYEAKKTGKNKVVKYEQQ